MDPLQVLNSHLDEIVLAGKAYPRAKAERVYAKLNAPKTTGRFYDKNRVRGTIDEDGQVAFKTQYPELADDYPEGWSYHSPEQLGMERTSPKPVRGLIGMQKAFQEHLRNPDGSIRSKGAGLYYNTPVSEHRAAAYQGQGMVAVPGINHQVLDNRRFQNNPTIAELTMRMDAENMPSNIAQVLREPILARHPQLQTVLETVHLPAAQTRSMSSLSSTYGSDYDEIMADILYYGG